MKETRRRTTVSLINNNKLIKLNTKDKDRLSRGLSLFGQEEFVKKANDNTISDPKSIESCSNESNIIN